VALAGVRLGDGQAPVLYALGADQSVGELAHLTGFSAQHDDFEALR